MPKLVCLVLDNEALVDQILDAWTTAGVRGATIVESTGLARRRGYLRDDVPLFPSISTLLQSNRERNVVLFSVVSDDVDVARLLAETEKVTGDLDGPYTGIFFAVQLHLAKGSHLVE